MNINNTTNPVVSVIMPAYNAESYIEEAITSVINQTMDSWELIVLDDCSKDNSFELAKAQQKKDLRINVIRNNVNMGVAKTRNVGISLAKGEYIAFLDSDDVWHPQKLQCQIEKIKSENAGICYCSYAIIDSCGHRVKADYMVPTLVSYEELLKENCIQCSAMLIQADIVKQIQFNTEYYHEDYILGLDILRAGEKAVGCTEILLDWRLIQNSRSYDKKKSAVNRWKIYRSYLKLPLCKTLYVFACYTAAGMKKYLRRYK